MRRNGSSKGINTAFLGVDLNDKKCKRERVEP